MTTKGYERFSADLAEFANTLGIELDKAIRKVSLDVFTGIVKKTPVDKGALRANWAIGVNKEVTKRPLDKGVKLSAGATGSAAMKDVSHLSKVKAGDRVIISNNMPYARVVEYGEIKGDGGAEESFLRLLLRISVLRNLTSWAFCQEVPPRARST